MLILFQVSLIYANVSPDDILLKKKLDMLAASHVNLKVPPIFLNFVNARLCYGHLWLLLFIRLKYQVFYTVDNPSKYWVGGTGYISKDMASKGLPAPSEDTLILVRSHYNPMHTCGGVFCVFVFFFYC